VLRGSKIDKVDFAGRQVYVKRDDLLVFKQADIGDGVESTSTSTIVGFNGNKARKFYYLLSQDLSTKTKLVSYGSAQSNSLPVLAALAKHKGLLFDFYVDHIAKFLKHNPAGNYASALALGANIIELKLKSNLHAKGGAESTSSEVSLEQYVTALVSTGQDVELVPEGGRIVMAQQGIEQLAIELIDWYQQHSFKALNLMLPAGTGTTAVLLQQSFVRLNCPIKVYTCACVGDEQYLKAQFKQLVEDEHLHPVILSTAKKYHFGQLYQELYQLWQQLERQTGITFELLYDPQAWQIILAGAFDVNIPLIYIHQGGLPGNETMQARYRRKLGH